MGPLRPFEPGDQFEHARAAMLRSIRFHKEVTPRTVDAMARVRREVFVPARLVARAYEDAPLEIGHRQTISAPHMVAIMASVLAVRPGQSVLDVGTGSGYHAAVLAELVGPAGRVLSYEVVPELAHSAQAALATTGYANVEVRCGDGVTEAAGEGPFDRISVAAGSPAIPAPLVAQLKPGGRMVIPIGEPDYELVTVDRAATLGQPDVIARHGACRFVPLRGRHVPNRAG